MVMLRRPTISESSYRLAESLYSGHQDSDPDPLGLADWIGFITISEARVLNRIYNKFLFFEPLLTESHLFDRMSLWESFLLKETSVLSELVKDAVRGAWDRVSRYVGKKWSGAAEYLDTASKEHAKAAWGKNKGSKASLASSSSKAANTAPQSNSSGKSNASAFEKIKAAATKEIDRSGATKLEANSASENLLELIKHLSDKGMLSQDMTSSYMRNEEVPDSILNKLLGSEADERSMKLALKSLFKIGAINKIQ